MRKRIQKYQQGNFFSRLQPATSNSGFDFAQQMSLQTPQFTNQVNPGIAAMARAGDPNAIKMQTDYNASNFNQQLEIFQGETQDSVTTARAGGTEGSKIPFSQSKLGKGMNIAGQAALMVGDMMESTGKFSNYVTNNNTQLRKNISQAGRQVASMFGPIGMAIAGADSMIDATGGKSDASQGLGKANDFGNMVASIALPGLGWALPKGKKFSKDETVAQSSAFTGTNKFFDTVEGNSGGKFLFGADQHNSMAIRANAMQEDILAQLNDSKDRRAAASYNGTALGNEIELHGGIKTLRAKEGIKLDLLEARRILKNYKSKEPEIEVFREGGKVNVIPEGSLHKNRHRMEEVDDSFKDLTTKGIPVVTEGEGGELVQQAEIERNEIIFNLNVTKKLEELMQDGSEEAALEAGKLLAIEIIENTIDNTGLIKEIS